MTKRRTLLISYEAILIKITNFYEFTKRAKIRLKKWFLRLLGNILKPM